MQQAGLKAIREEFNRIHEVETEKLQREMNILSSQREQLSNTKTFPILFILHSTI